MSRVVGLPQTTLRRHLTLLEALFLIEFLPAWHVRASRRLVKASKLFVTDSGLAAHLTGVEAEQAAGVIPSRTRG